MRLSPRLLKLAGKVPDYAVVADIGTDHALLPIYLVSTGKCPRAIAVEVHEGPYEVARAAIESFAMGDAVDLRRGDGLKPLMPGEVDAVVIAGLGGGQMIRMLEDAPQVRASVPWFVFQPMDDAADLRRFLVDHGFRLADEELVRDGDEIYEIICAAPGRERIDDDLLYEVGPRNVERRDPLLAEFIERRIQRYRRILIQVEQGRTQRAVDAMRELQRLIRRLDDLARTVTAPARGAVDRPNADPDAPFPWPTPPSPPPATPPSPPMMGAGR
ncbi:MAG TPA: class I SAM-dependent methyltransferase [Trebonia sp.]